MKTNEFNPVILEEFYEAAFEAYDFGTCQRSDGSYYGHGGTKCHKGVEASKDDLASQITKNVGGGPAVQKRLSGMGEQDLVRIANGTKGGLSLEQSEELNTAVKTLIGEKAGGKKEGGQNLQDPGEAGKYAEFYEKKKDLTYKAPKDTDIKVVRATLAQLKDEDPESYKTTMSALNGKGSPPKEMREAAGWKGQERGEAVLKSLMDNEFKDVLGKEASWRQGLQLDHRKAGSMGGKDTPDNWIWISTASNQAKGGMEAAVKKSGLTGKAADDYVRQGLISKLKTNAGMTKEAVAAKKAGGSAAAQAKSARAAALRDNLPVMSKSQRAKTIETAKGDDLKSMLKASVGSGKNPVTGRNTSYRPVLSGGNGERVRKAYGTTPQMRALLKARWGEPLTSADKKALGQMLNASTGSSKSSSQKLDETFGNFPPSSPISASDRADILSNAS
jgi:hypothetical protein